MVLEKSYFETPKNPSMFLLLAEQKSLILRLSSAPHSQICPSDLYSEAGILISMNFSNSWPSLTLKMIKRAFYIV